MRKIVLVLTIFFMTPAPLYAENEYGLILDSARSIVLPSFDTSSVALKNVEEIVLSLYVLEKTPASSDFVQITINPFDPRTKKVEDGLSSFIKPQVNNYVDFRLPKDLFEETLGTDKRFLIKIAQKDTKIIFADPEAGTIATNPKLVLVHGEKPDDGASYPIVVNNYNFDSIDNSQLHFGSGDNIGGIKPMLKNQPSDPKGINNPYLVTIVGGVITGLLLYFLTGKVKEDEPSVPQNHFGSGDNVAGDKVVTEIKALFSQQQKINIFPSSLGFSDTLNLDNVATLKIDQWVDGNLTLVRDVVPERLTPIKSPGFNVADIHVVQTKGKERFLFNMKDSIKNEISAGGRTFLVRLLEVEHLNRPDVSLPVQFIFGISEVPN